MRLKSIDYLGHHAMLLADPLNETELRRVGVAGLSGDEAAAIITITDRAVSPIKKKPAR